MTVGPQARRLPVLEYKISRSQTGRNLRRQNADHDVAMLAEIPITRNNHCRPNFRLNGARKCRYHHISRLQQPCSPSSESILAAEATVNL